MGTSKVQENFRVIAGELLVPLGLCFLVRSEIAQPWFRRMETGHCDLRVIVLH